MQRGLFIVFEGLDRSGKTTQSKLLAAHFNNTSQQQTEWMCFPDTVRTRNYTTQVLESYRNVGYVCDDPSTLNMLFSRNRELAVDSFILPTLLKGTNVVCDRYFDSGIAYSLANEPGLTVSTALHREYSLIVPDVVIFLDTPVDICASRENFGADANDTHRIQTSVRNNYLALKKHNWIHIEITTETPDIIHQKILNELKNSESKIVEKVSKFPILLYDFLTTKHPQ